MFSTRLKKLRLEKEWSQEYLARRLGCSRTAISAYELGRNQPSYEDLIRIAELFGCAIDYLVGKTDDPTPYTETKKAYPSEDGYALTAEPGVEDLSRIFERIKQLPREQQDQILAALEMTMSLLAQKQQKEQESDERQQ